MDASCSPNAKAYTLTNRAGFQGKLKRAVTRRGLRSRASLPYEAYTSATETAGRAHVYAASHGRAKPRSVQITAAPVSCESA